MPPAKKTVSGPDTELPLYKSLDLAGTVMSYRNQNVTHHGEHGDDPALVYPGRRVVEVPGRTWPASRPEECTNFSLRGVWLDLQGNPCDPDDSYEGGIVLVCPFCGLDVT